MTDSLKLIVNIKVSPAIKNPSSKLEETETTRGTDPFTKMSLLSDKELPEPITGIVKNVLLPAVSIIDPLFKLIGFELRYSKSRELSELCTV